MLSEYSVALLITFPHYLDEKYNLDLFFLYIYLMFKITFIMSTFIQSAYNSVTVGAGQNIRSFRFTCSGGLEEVGIKPQPCDLWTTCSTS